MTVEDLIALFCISDDVCKTLNVLDDPQCKMTSAEVIFVAVVAARWFQGRLAPARLFLLSHRYIPNMLSHGKLKRRMLGIDQELWILILHLLSEALKMTKQTSTFAIDSFPVPACHPARSRRCKLFHGRSFLGYCASKKLHYFGLKAHIVVSTEGQIVELFFSPASTADIKALELAYLHIPDGSRVFADRAYTNYSLEDELMELAGLQLVPQRKKNHKRQHSGCLAFLQSKGRKVVETVISQVSRFMPRGVCARSPWGFILRIFLFALAYSFDQLCSMGRSVC